MSEVNLLLLTGTKYPWTSRRSLGQRTPLNVQALAPYILAAVTPANYNIRFAEISSSKVNSWPDLVGFSFTTVHAPQAYRLSSAFRSLGIKTVAGGIHATLMPAEVGKFFNAVVVGAGETAWPQVLAGFSSGQLQNQYYGPQPEAIPQAARPSNRGLNRAFDLIEASRGCVHDCGGFCGVKAFFGQRYYKTRPLDDVIAEMRLLGKNIYLADNNLLANYRFGKELLTRMIGLNKRWMGAATLQTFVKHPALADLLRVSGCLAIFVGLESLQQENIAGRGKNVAQYEAGIKILHDAGIMVGGSFVLGLDGDNWASLAAIPGFIDKTGLDVVSLNIATPFPGTSYFREIDQAGRILHRNWSLYDTEHVVFRPKHFTPESLQECYHQIFRQVFSLRSAFTRQKVDLSVPAPAIVAGNLLNRLGFELAQAAQALV